MDREPAGEMPEVDPKDFVRAVLGISAEDAEKVREDTPGTRKRPEPQHGPERDYGNENNPGP
jgi:hypothetical protein